MERKRSNKGIKKLMCMLLAIALTVTLIPGGFARPDSASAEEPKLITSVDIYGIDVELEAGANLFFKGYCNSGAPYHLASTQEMEECGYDPDRGRDGFIWREIAGYDVPQDATFVEGEKYDFIAVLVAKDGYKFADTVECSINGDKTLVAESTSYESDLAIVSIPLEAKTYQKITTVYLLNLDKPVAGKKPDYNVSVPAGAPYRLATTQEMDISSLYGRNGIIWSDKMGTMEIDSATYSLGDKYDFSALLYAKPGYKFAYAVGCSINNDIFFPYPFYSRNYGKKLDIHYDEISVAPPATKSLSVKLYGYDDIKASWSKVTGATGYKVYYKKSTAKDYTYKGKTTGTTMSLANLADGAKYYVKVIPYRIEMGETLDGPSKTSSGIYTLKKLNTPKVNKYSSSKVKVTWNNIAGESGYQISRSTKKTGTNVVSTYSTTSGKYKVLKTTRNKTYYYKVRAYKTVDGKKIYGPWSYVKSYKLK